VDSKFTARININTMYFARIVRLVLLMVLKITSNHFIVQQYLTYGTTQCFLRCMNWIFTYNTDSYNTHSFQMVDVRFQHRLEVIKWVVKLCFLSACIFRRLRKIAKSYFWICHGWSSACPHGTTRLLLDGFSWNLIFEYFSKICQEIIKFH
jgi:hypothetical protein